MDSRYIGLSAITSRMARTTTRHGFVILPPGGGGGGRRPRRIWRRQTRARTSRWYTLYQMV